MTPELRVEVIGLPAPQGSKRHVGGGRMIESSKAVAPWRDSVVYATRDAMRAVGWETVDGPCEVRLTFYVPRPVSAPKSRTRPHVKPDLDKLVRSTLDALTTVGAIRDDARVVELWATKKYVGDWGTHAGASIAIAPLGPSRKDTTT